MPADFQRFFSVATGHRCAPYPYQQRLANGDGGVACESLLISIPTGLGKTAAVVLAWLWNRVVQQRSDWPRRLVYCLPMRTLVEQTEEETKKWIDTLCTHAAELGLSGKARDDLNWLRERSPIVLMGGEDLDANRRDWDLYPERPALLIGTQDMLLSRALNRGYGMSRYRWPMHFALLNHDALWVLDETQLIGVGIETSAQLDAFRRTFAASLASATSVSRAFTWWMSATLSDKRLSTVDQPLPLGLSKIELSKEDHHLRPVEQRFASSKPLSLAPKLRLSGSSEKETTAYAKELAALVHERHQAGTLTLVVLNSVVRAQLAYRALKELGSADDSIALIHSRFRPGDRERHQKLLFSQGDRIVVATQAVEAGVDVSARLLVTELAPWSSLVQRFGRCNRAGTLNDAEILWIDMADDDKITAPYSAVECAAARTVLLAPLNDAGPKSLASIQAPQEPRVIRPVLRRKDLLDLFDTTPDIAGNDLDISRYVRDGNDTDVQVFWRDLDGQAPASDLPSPTRAELCRVSLIRFRDFSEKLSTKTEFSAYVWDPLEEKWSASRRVRPGAVYLLDYRVGGYSADIGWTGELADPKHPTQQLACLPPGKEAAAEANSTDRGAVARTWVTLADHTLHVEKTTVELSHSIGLPDGIAEVLHSSARWHDLGKAHLVFQNALKLGLLPNAIPPDDPEAFYAKSPNSPRPYSTPGFRHELASALAILLASPAGLPERDLIAYLVAAHHGKVRLSIRALPGELPPREKPDAHCARGIVDGDLISAAAFSVLGLGKFADDLPLDLSFMEMGEGKNGPSWLARSLALRDRFGPFQLAYLETLLRAADMRASAAETQNP
jgi:CRISPR-associated endonuclease/helicase Cas3